MKINLTYDDEENDGSYGHPASIKVRTTGGKVYSFGADDCWTEGLGSLSLVRNRLFYCSNSGEITSPRGLAAVFYFADIWESWPEFIFPTFDFLCGIMSTEDYITLMKSRSTCVKRDLETVDPASCSHDQLMQILEPHMPEYSKDAIAPYIRFSKEVQSLGKIESIDITIY